MANKKFNEDFVMKETRTMIFRKGVLRLALAALLLAGMNIWNPPSVFADQHPGVLQSESAAVDTGVRSVNRSCKAHGELFARTELFFGALKPDGSMVTFKQFRRFLNREITSRFPDGLTLLVGLGQFRGSSGETIRERSMLLILLYPLGDNGSDERIEEIREAYKDRFDQESVLRADSRSCVSF